MSKGECFPMSDNITVELTPEQLDTVLQGLRYVRRSVMLDFHYPDPEFDRERQSKVREIEAIAAQLSGAPVRREATPVS